MDHLVFAAPDLDDGVRHVEELMGVEMAPGGRHAGFGTRNRLLGFGPSTYMEVVSVDPSQPSPARPRWFGLDTLDRPRLVTWCAAVHDLDGVVARGRAAGLDLGDPVQGSRRRPDGSVLAWSMTDPWADRAGGVIPFFIDWGDTVHPGTSLPAPCAFLGLRAEHPDPASVRAWCEALDLSLEVTRGDAARLIATIRTPHGVVELT